MKEKSLRDRFRGCLIAAVNHDGDSDSTGAIAGNILGARLGLSGIPEDFTARPEGVPLLSGCAPAAAYRLNYSFPEEHYADFMQRNT